MACCSRRSLRYLADGQSVRGGHARAWREGRLGPGSRSWRSPGGAGADTLQLAEAEEAEGALAHLADTPVRFRRCTSDDDAHLAELGVVGIRSRSS